MGPLIAGAAFVASLFSTVTIGNPPPPTPVPIAEAIEWTLSGTVRNARTGALIEDAQISILSLGVSVLSGADGSFRVTGLPEGPVTLRVEMVGYARAEYVVTPDQAPLEVLLPESAIEMDELVVTGTPAAAQRRSLGNSFVALDASNLDDITPTRELSQMLNGKAPGLTIREGGGQVGGPVRMVTRGRSSLALEPEPMIYVDGIRVNNDAALGRYSPGAPRLNDIDPGDIERIEVLRGPAAATLYGTEASNGVIQIFTKRGRPGEARLEVTVSQGARWFQDLEDRWPTNYYRDPATDEVLSMNLAQREKERGTPLFRNGHSQSYGLDLSGGSDVIQYFVSGTYDSDEGINRDNHGERFAGTLNLTAQPLETVDITATMSTSFIRNDLASPAHMGNALGGNPRDLDTPLRGFSGAPQDIVAEQENLAFDANRYSSSLRVAFRPFSWLSTQLSTGVERREERSGFLIPVADERRSQFYSGFSATGQKAHQRRTTTNSTVDLSTTATFALSSSLSSSTSIGGQYYRDRTDFLDVFGLIYPAPGLSSVTSAALQLVRDDREIVNTTVGTYVQQQLSWSDRLFLTAAIRADDNSAFGQDFDLATYPKVSASWVISEEDFFDVGGIDELKLRGAYGESGLQPEAFAAVRTFRPTSSPDGESVVVPDSPGNDELGPERGRELEFGFDLSLFAGRVGVDFSYYDQVTTSAIVLREDAPSSGFVGQSFINAGRIENRGVELLVNTTPVRTSSLHWDFGFNLAYNDNEVVELGLDGTPFLQVGTRPPSRHQVGYPVQSIWGKQVISADLDPSGKAMNVLCAAETGPGRPCEDAPLVYLGRPDPNFTGGVNSSFAWGDWRLSGSVDFQAGARKLEGDFSWQRCARARLCEENVYPERFDPTRIAEIQQGGDLLSTHIVGTDFAKLRDVSLQYQVPGDYLTGFNLSGATVTLSARNLYTWVAEQDPPPGFDPESFITGDFTQQLWSSAREPQPAVFLTTVRLRF